MTAAGIVPLSVGGDHSISLPILRAVAARGPVGMVHIDAHCDTGDDYMGSRFHHGAPFRRAVEEELLDPHARHPDRHPRHDQRSGHVGLQPAQRHAGARMDEFDDLGWRSPAEEARRVAGGGPVYLTFDIDSLDPEPGARHWHARKPAGITALEALRLLRALRGLDFVGGDLVEVAPPFDVGTLTAFNGASILFEILCLLAEAHEKRQASHTVSV